MQRDPKNLAEVLTAENDPTAWPPPASNRPIERSTSSRSSVIPIDDPAAGARAGAAPSAPCKLLQHLRRSLASRNGPTAPLQIAQGIARPNHSEDAASAPSNPPSYFISPAGVCMIGLVASFAQAREAFHRHRHCVTLSIAVLIWALFKLARCVSWRLSRTSPQSGWRWHRMGVALFILVMAFFAWPAKNPSLPRSAHGPRPISRRLGWAMVVLMVAFSAIFEELAFRGTILSALSRACARRKRGWSAP